MASAICISALICLGINCATKTAIIARLSWWFELTYENQKIPWVFGLAFRFADLQTITYFSTK